mmetsp:Transcript_28265/g.68695  ORF Transcript_28265/g.68695 Transcript_28265/m.68695 type:complete len:426 (+) Transcript_28265:924-2201(+)
MVFGRKSLPPLVQLEVAPPVPLAISIALLLSPPPRRGAARGGGRAGGRARRDPPRRRPTARRRRPRDSPRLEAEGRRVPRVRRLADAERDHLPPVVQVLGGAGVEHERVLRVALLSLHDGLLELVPHRRDEGGEAVDQLAHRLLRHDDGDGRRRGGERWLGRDRRRGAAQPHRDGLACGATAQPWGEGGRDGGAVACRLRLDRREGQGRRGLGDRLPPAYAHDLAPQLRVVERILGGGRVVAVDKRHEATVARARLLLFRAWPHDLHRLDGAELGELAEEELLRDLRRQVANVQVGRLWVLVVKTGDRWLHPRLVRVALPAVLALLLLLPQLLHEGGHLRHARVLLLAQRRRRRRRRRLLPTDDWRRDALRAALRRGRRGERLAVDRLAVDVLLDGEHGLGGGARLLRLGGGAARPHLGWRGGAT